MGGDSKPADPFRAWREGAEAFSRALAEALEKLRPGFEAMVSYLNRPEVRAAAEAAGRSRRPYRPCHCLCGKLHPGEMGICDMDAVATRHYDTALTGPVDVPLCAPCAAAAGLADLATGG